MNSNYWVLTIQTLDDGTQPASLLGYTTFDEADIVWHNTCSASKSNSNMSSYVCKVINAHGGEERKDYWERPVTPELNEE